jgi:dipeptidyl-peptidase 4
MFHNTLKEQTMIMNRKLLLPVLTTKCTKDDRKLCNITTMRKSRIQLLALLFLFCGNSFAQEEKMDLQTYQQALSYTRQNINKKVFNLNPPINWIDEGNAIWFIKESETGKEYMELSVESKVTKPLFDHEKFASALSEQISGEVKAADLELGNLKAFKEKLEFKADGKTFVWDRTAETLSLKEEIEAENKMESESPDGKWVAFRKDHNLYLKEKATGKEFQLSRDGEKNYDYAGNYGWGDLMYGEGATPPEAFSVQWSPDSKYLATQVSDVRKAQRMYLLNYTIDSLYRPQLVSYYRGSPGDTTMVMVKPVLYNVETKQQLKTDLPVNTHINVARVRFAEEPNIAYAQWLERGFQKQVVQKMDLESQTQKNIWEETSDSSIDNFEFRPLKKSEKSIILSEKSGWKQLYLLNEQTGSTSPLTSGEFVVNSIVHVDEETGQVYFMASGVDPEMNPYHQQLYTVKEGENMRLLTPEKLHHEVNVSEQGNYFTDEISSVDTATKVLLRELKSGNVLTEVIKADVSKAAAEGWEPPQTFSLKGKDGKTPIYGAVWKPTNFDPNKKYPVIDATYTGPHTQVYPKSFGRAFQHQALAELGFVVVAIDGLGTAGRSKAFRNHSYKNMGNNLEDHVKAIRHLGQQYSWIDIDRVGIFGHSAGGYDTGRALLAFPEFYKVGVASSGDHDFRMEKAWWPEMYMGWPVDESYEAVSNVTNAKNLQGKFF